VRLSEHEPNRKQDLGNQIEQVVRDHIAALRAGGSGVSVRPRPLLSDQPTHWLSVPPPRPTSGSAATTVRAEVMSVRRQAARG
jgi:hypothetical protein